jgi:hypothetical protein
MPTASRAGAAQPAASPAAGKSSGESTGCLEMRFRLRIQRWRLGELVRGGMVRKKGAYRRHAERDPLQHHGSGVLRGPRRRLLIVRRRILLRRCPLLSQCQRAAVARPDPEPEAGAGPAHDCGCWGFRGRGRAAGVGGAHRRAAAAAHGAPENGAPDDADDGGGE